MSEPARCPRCGATLPPGTAPEACPKCLMRVGLEQTEPGGETQTSYGGASWTAPRPEEIAADFPQLEILEVLGQGGMGVVYKARQRSLDRMVALKILAVPGEAGPDFAERFGREARALASLGHPSIVTVYDFGRAGGRYYLLMEYVDGANLHQLIHNAEIAPRQALQLVTQICDALQFAHDAGVVHRDIKPENILVNKKGRVMIADFGLARIMGKAGDESRLTGAGQVMGTAHYMAPEQIEKPLEVDHRADIYSLGVVFYELLTGELPLGRFQPPSRKIEVDVRVDEVVLKTLEKEPQLRYQTAGEIKTDVEGISTSFEEKQAEKKQKKTEEEPGIYAAAFSLDFPGWAWWALGGAALLAVFAAVLLLITLSGGPRDLPARAVVAPWPGEPLVQAASGGHLEGVAVLLENGFDVNDKGPGGTSAIIEAVDGGHFEIVRLLLDRGADVNASRSGGVTALLVGSAQGNREIIEALLDAGADVNAAGPGGTTPLMQAVDGGHFEIVRRLLERGADVNALGPGNATALLYASAQGELNTVAILLEAGANVDVVGPGGTTALLQAIDGGHSGAAVLLIAAGANVNAVDPLGLTPLHYAASSGRAEIVARLVEAGADVDAANRVGDTPLVFAVRENHPEVARILLGAGADTKRALTAAAAEGRTELMELFRP